MRDILLLQLGRLGDLVQTLPLIHRLKAEHPGAQVSMVCLETFQAILSGSGGWDRLFPVALSDVEALADPAVAAGFPLDAPWSSHPALAGEFDLLVNLTHDQGSAVLAERIRAARKLGRVPAPQGELRLLGDGSKYLFSMVGHRKENLFNLVDLQAGMADLAPRRAAPCMQVPEPRRDEARALLLAAGWKGGRPLVALQTAASDLHRAWDADAFADLAALLSADGAEVVLVGDAKEVERAARIRDRVGADVPLLDLVGKTGLPQLPAVAAACDLLVSNDTGTIHVAAGVGTPTLGLYFATAYYSETAPYGEGHAVLQVEIPCSPCNTTTRCAVQACRGHLPVEAVHAAARFLLRPGTPAPSLPPTLAFYRSRFLANGSLLYAPVDPDRISGHYAIGLLGRILWEGATGHPTDPALASYWSRAADSPEGRSRVEELAGDFATLAELLERGRSLAGRMRAAFAGGHADLVHPLHAQLAGLGQSLARSAARCGLFGSYLNFALMDMDYSGYPELAVELEDKYARLRDRVENAISTLAGLRGDGKPLI